MSQRFVEVVLMAGMPSEVTGSAAHRVKLVSFVVQHVEWRDFHEEELGGL